MCEKMDVINPVFKGVVPPITGTYRSPTWVDGIWDPDIVKNEHCWFCADDDGNCMDPHHRCPSCGNWRIKWYKVDMDDGRGWLSRCLNCEHWFPDPIERT